MWNIKQKYDFCSHISLAEYIISNTTFIQGKYPCVKPKAPHSLDINAYHSIINYTCIIIGHQELDLITGYVI